MQANIPSDPSTLKTQAASPAYLNKRYGGEFLSSQSGNHRQPMEEVGNIEVRSNSTNKKKPSFDLQDLLMVEASHPWSHSSTTLKPSQNGEDDKDTSSGEWVDKVMLNKNENSLSHCDGNFTALPDFFYQRYVSDSTAYQDQPYSRSGHLRKESRFDSVTTDDSDDLDVATSDSSEADALWQFNLPKSTSNSGGSKIKKPQIKPVDSPDFRTPTYAYIPSSSSSSRKISSGASRVSRQPSSAGMDGKRTISSSGGKLNSGK